MAEHRLNKKKGQGSTSTSSNETIVLDSSYRLFIESIRSPHRWFVYNEGLKYFMKFIKVSEYHNLLEKDPNLIQTDIIEYILYLKDTRNIAPATINTYLALSDISMISTN